MNAPSETIHARAPLRMSLAGGGTDVQPYPRLQGGAVLSVTIDWFAYATVSSRPRDGVAVHSPDLLTAQAMSGRAKLAQVVLADARVADSAEVTLHCDAPPGSGLGSSSSLIVAMAAALAEHRREHLGPYELAARAVRIEREDLGVPGGLQDQYAAVFGGFNFIEFNGDQVVVSPLRLRDDVVAELHGSLVLVPSPEVRRRSAGILSRQIDQTRAQDPQTMDRLGAIKQMALDLKVALLTGDLAAVGQLLHEGWMAKRVLADGITSGEIDELYAIGRQLGATGGKLLGAGGGGFILYLVPFENRGTFVRGLRDRGIDPRSLSFTETGVQSWRPAAGRG